MGANNHAHSNTHLEFYWRGNNVSFIFCLTPIMSHPLFPTGRYNILAIIFADFWRGSTIPAAYFRVAIFWNAMVIKSVLSPRARTFYSSYLLPFAATLMPRTHFHVEAVTEYAVEAQTSLAPLSWFHGSRVTTAHVHQCCIFQSYAKTVPSRMKLTMKLTMREPASMTTDT